MKWLARLFSQGGLTNPDKGPQSAGPSSHKTDSGLVLTDERAMSLSAVWSCVRLITETVGGLPLHVYERTPDGRKETESHYLYDLLRVSPNAFMTPLEFREAMTMQLALWGNAYSVIERDGKGMPVALTPLRSDRVTPIREAGTVTYHYHMQDRDHVFAKESIFHLKGFSVDGIIGLSPIAYARHTFGISASADKFASKSFSSNGRPHGYITVDRMLTPDQRNRLSDIYQAASVDDTQTWVFEAGAKYNAISMPPDDMQLLESRAFQLSEIARIFRVPSYLINDTEKSTSWGTGIEQQNLAFLTYTLQPYLSRWESTISNALLDRAGRRKYFASHNVEGLLRADSAARAAFYSQACQNGWMSRNEIRRKENLPPVDGGDELTVQVNLAPIDELPGAVNGNQAASDRGM